MGSAKILGENEDVVRVMSIHKSKGLEFPVVFLSGCGKKFNLMDLNRNILFHEELGYGPDFIDYKRRISFPTIKKQALKKKFKLESLSEEMRVLYVAFTRAKEKLIITASVADFEKYSVKCCSAASQGEIRVPDYEVVKGRSYMDWIGMAIAKHKDGEILRKKANSTIGVTIHDELSTWDIKIWSKSDIIVDKNIETVEENLEELDTLDSESNKAYHYEEIRKRLEWKYKYIEASKIPANISVSELKKSASLEDEDDNNVLNIYRSQIIKKPEFLQEEKGLSSAEKGTAVHGVMQRLDLSKVSSVAEIEEQLTFMIAKEFLTEEEVKVVRSSRVLKFFQSSLGKRLLRVYNQSGRVYKEIPFYIDMPAKKVNKDLVEDIYKDEMVRLQGVIDCYFEEEDGNIVLLDYKTDYVGDEVTIDDIKKRYEVQIKYYSDTLEMITGKTIKEKYLYLFYNGEIIPM